MRLEGVKIGMRVKTAGRLGNTGGMFVGKKHLDARKPRKNGKVVGHVPGHGGDVLWVSHNDDTVGAYMFNELDPA
jgi:hypothetical protein